MMIVIDGAQGEGGGQIVRTALALAMCTQQPVRIHNIRAKRSKPGLMRQHLVCVQAAAAVSSAVVDGAELGSTQLSFEPSAVKAGNYAFNVGSAGSCMLVLQTVLPALMTTTGESQLVLRGGTHNPLAPSFHAIEQSFAPLLRRLGVHLQMQLRRHGFYPAGGGECTATISRGSDGLLQPFDLLERGDLREAYAECLAAAIPAGVSSRELEVLAAALGWNESQLRHGQVRQNEGPGNALMATLVHAHLTEHFVSYGVKGVAAEQVAKNLAQQVKDYRAVNAALGSYLADQWMLPLALAVVQRGGTASYTCTEITQHAMTQRAIIETFLPVRIAIERDSIGGWRVALTAEDDS